jgi:nucleoside-diphosphate kinase
VLGYWLWACAARSSALGETHLLISNDQGRIAKDKPKNQTFQVGCELYVRTFMQKTLIIFKPDCMQQRHVGNVLNRFEQAGFAIVGCKMMQLTPAILREHYAHVADKPFYPEIETFMSSQPVIVLALQGDHVVQKVRDLLGPTDSRKAAKGTIRGDFGTEMMKNVVHASDTVENAKIELSRFFKPGEILAANPTIEKVC